MEIVHSKEYTGNWQKTLWLEIHYCNDKDYAQHLKRFLSSNPFAWIYRLNFRNQDRPYAADVEGALRTACTARYSAKYLWKERLVRLDEAKKKRTPIKKLIKNLEDHHWLERFISRQVLLHRGSEAVPHLLTLSHQADDTLRTIAIWLLQSIGEETRERLAETEQDLFCVDCVVHYQKFKVNPSQVLPITYYGCPICRQSHSFRTWPDGVTVILDRTTSQEKFQKDTSISVNWLVEQTLFDFDQVEIIAATDEEIERFAVQVGNNTDNKRREKYQTIVCTLSPKINISDNTRRILEFTFGQIQIQK